VPSEEAKMTFLSSAVMGRAAAPVGTAIVIFGVPSIIVLDGASA
jgi:hypothetical protein